MNDCIRLPRVLHRLEGCARSGSEFHRLGQHYDKVLSPVQSLGIERGFSAVWHVIADLELGLSGTQREHESVAVLLFLRHWSRVDGLATGGHRHALVNLGTVGKIKLEALIAHLGARRIRSIIHGEKADEVAAAGAGGLSGAPLRERALEVLRRLHARAGGRLVLIAVGGIESPDDAWERLRAGATLVQAYTGFIYGGPRWPRRMHDGLARRARAAGLASIGEAVGREPGAGMS